MTLIGQNLTCERNGRVVFSDLSFSLRPGSCVELRGANGAGKSSLLRMLAGLVPVASGAVTFRDEPEFAQSLHFIAHQDAMKTTLSVSENLEFWCKVLGGKNIERALSVFKLEGLKDDPVQFLSAGQRRRLTLSRLFLVERPLWLLDEPMTALDAASQDVLRTCTRTHLKGGGMVLAATHGDLGVSPDHIITLGAA